MVSMRNSTSRHARGYLISTCRYHIINLASTQSALEVAMGKLIKIIDHEEDPDRPIEILIEVKEINAGSDQLSYDVPELLRDLITGADFNISVEEVGES